MKIPSGFYYLPLFLPSLPFTLSLSLLYTHTLSLSLSLSVCLAPLLLSPSPSLLNVYSQNLFSQVYLDFVLAREYPASPQVRITLLR